MHDGCSAEFQSGKQIVDKIRAMGFNTSPLGAELKFKCTNCDSVFQMTHMESQCPSCSMVYGVTPCHSHSTQFVKAAGVNY
jgi:rubrerythrin